MSLRRALSRSIGAALATTLLAITAGTGAMAAPPFTLEERALAIASPSLVFIEVRYEGFVYLHATGGRLQETPTVFFLRCSGVAVNTDGYVITETDCVRPNDATLRVLAGYSVAGHLVDEKKLTPDKINQYANDLANRSSFAGIDPDSRPTSQITGQLFSGASQAQSPPAMSGDIAYSTAVSETNTALIRFSGAKLPVAELSKTAMTGGMSAFAAGYATTDADANHATYLPKSQAVDVTGNENEGLRLSGDVGPFSRGGAVVDDNGRLLGVLQLDRQSPQGLNRSVQPDAAVTDILSKAGVQNALTATDLAYRAGLDDYFGGRYSEAIKEFDRVLAAMPQHRSATAYRQQALNRIAIEGESGTPTWLILLLSIGGGILLIALLVGLAFFFGRRSSRNDVNPDQLPTIGLNPFSSPPMSPLPISNGGYAYGQQGPAELVINPAPQGMPVPQPPTLPAPPAPEPATNGQAVEPTAVAPVTAPPALPESLPTHQPPTQPLMPPSITAADFTWPEDADDDQPGRSPDNPWAPPAQR